MLALEIKKLPLNYPVLPSNNIIVFYKQCNVCYNNVSESMNSSSTAPVYNNLSFLSKVVVLIIISVNLVVTVVS